MRDSRCSCTPPSEHMPDQQGTGTASAHAVAVQLWLPLRHASLLSSAAQSLLLVAGVCLSRLSGPSAELPNRRCGRCRGSPRCEGPECLRNHRTAAKASVFPLVSALRGHSRVLGIEAFAPCRCSAAQSLSVATPLPHALQASASAGAGYRAASHSLEPLDRHGSRVTVCHGAATSVLWPTMPSNEVLLHVSVALRLPGCLCQRPPQLFSARARAPLRHTGILERWINVFFWAVTPDS
jgi:hypothetical protein